MNLATNAIEAIESNGVRRLRITSGLVQGSSDMRVTVEDSGGGINQQDKEAIFDPFFTTKSAGTGIGLTICRTILDAHGGSLRARPINLQGTVFEVIVPLDNVASD